MTINHHFLHRLSSSHPVRPIDTRTQPLNRRTAKTTYYLILITINTIIQSVINIEKNWFARRVHDQQHNNNYDGRRRSVQLKHVICMHWSLDSHLRVFIKRRSERFQRKMQIQLALEPRLRSTGDDMTQDPFLPSNEKNKLQPNWFLTF